MELGAVIEEPSELAHEIETSGGTHSGGALRSATEGFKFCPSCAEEIRVEAVKCRFCGEDLRPTSQNEQNRAAQQAKESSPPFYRGATGQIADSPPAPRRSYERNDDDSQFRAAAAT